MSMYAQAATRLRLLASYMSISMCVEQTPPCLQACNDLGNPGSLDAPPALVALQGLALWNPVYISL